MYKRITILYLIVLGITNDTVLAQQQTNINPDISYINVNIPKTPESAGFDKYGAPQVNEFTGTTNIAIPIYTLKSRNLTAPITLSYQATGIKVNQEASWVGLGFDLIAGGRITVETRGDVDFSGSTNGLFSKTILESGMQRIFGRLGNARENAVLTFATICEPDVCSATDNGFDITQAISDMTQFGAGEPDIFRANFMGHSFSFYFDKTTVTNSLPNPSYTIKFIGEQSLFKIVPYTDSYNNITSFTVTDTDGIIYYFNQTESITSSVITTPIPATATSSWLLTKAVHPNGDYIQFTYTNYGNSVPAFTMSSSITWDASTSAVTLPNDLNQNISIQSPYYLTRMESSDVAVNFALDIRTDLYGTGSRKLTQITVVDKLTNIVKKTATFNYSYFQSAIDQNSRNYLTGLPILPAGMSNSDYIGCSNSRLRLDSVNVNDNNYEPPYRFYYNTNVAIPDKYTLSQDHWGYYNGVSNQTNGYSFNHLIPYTFLGSILVNNNSFLNAVGGSNLGFNRECDPNLMQVMMLNKVVYPTGGYSTFLYEPHQSTMIPTVPITGGGLRVNTISNYAVSGTLLNSTTYSYTGGKYMGTIQYFTTANELSACSSPNNGHIRVNSSGAVNSNDILIGYGQITITQKDPSGNTNGSDVKTFNIQTPSSNYSNLVGYDISPAYMPSQDDAPPVININYPPSATTYLDPVHKNLPPTPSCNLEGKLMQEQYFDNNGNLLKSTNYYYHLANYTNNLYSVKAIQNRVGGFNLTGCSTNEGWGTGGLRPVILFVSPAKSFHTLTDSVVETEYFGGNSHVNRKYFTYDSYYQIKTQQFFNSDGTSTTTTYQHFYDFMGSGSTPIYQMMSANMLSTILTTTVTRNGQPVSFITNNGNNSFYSPSAGVFVPQYTQVQIAGNPIETRELYNGYDVYGHLLERQKVNGVNEDYLWGYDSQFPVAKIVGAPSNSAAASLVSSSILNAPSSDAALRQELSKLRTGLPAALVTIYTYDNVYGLTSVTDPTGRTSYYNYDPLGRLSYIQDQDLNVIKRYSYNYAGMPDGSTSVINTLMSALVSTTVPWVVTFTNTATSASSTFNAYPGSSATVFGNLPMGYYNISITPMYTLSGSAQLIFNGVTYTGTSFSLSYVDINGPNTFTLQPAPSSGPCSFTMSSGYSSPTNSISSNGTTASGYLVFYSGSTMSQGNSYFIATINGGCRPSATRSFSVSAGGRSWTVTIYSSGQMYVQMAYGSASLSPNSTVSISLSYTL